MVSGDEATEWLPVAIAGLIGYFAIKTFGGVQDTIDRTVDAPLSVVESAVQVPNTIFEGTAGILEGGFDFAGSAPSNTADAIGDFGSGIGDFGGDIYGGVTGGIGDFGGSVGSTFDSVTSGATNTVSDTYDSVTSWKFTGF